MKIRKAKIEDAKEVSKLRKKAFKEVNNKNYSKEHILAFNKKSTPKKILERMKNSKMFCADSKDNGLLGGLYVKHDLIGKGIGTKLVKFIENYAKKKGFNKIELYSTKESYRFYLKNNYKLLKKGFWEVGGLKVLNYHMEKEI